MNDNVNDWRENRQIGAVGNRTTNRIENTWNELKQFRTIYWTIPADYAQEYVDELVFRRNCRTFNWNKLEYLILILKN